MLFIAKLGTDYLASAALATMFANVSGFSFAIGMSTALETLCSQSHTGSSDRHSLGKHLQRAFLVIGLLCIPIACSWAYSESLLLFFGQDSLLAKLSGQYLIRLIPSLFAISAAECLERYLQAQGNLYLNILNESHYERPIACSLGPESY
jgi:MATE family multidrug resistance protein